MYIIFFSFLLLLFSLQVVRKKSNAYSYWSSSLSFVALQCDKQQQQPQQYQQFCGSHFGGNEMTKKPEKKTKKKLTTNTVKKY